MQVCSSFIASLLQCFKCGPSSLTKVHTADSLMLCMTLGHMQEYWIGVLQLMDSILVISSRPEKWGDNVTLACVAWFFYMLCDSRYMGPWCILSSAELPSY
jgi:hypothetical protein